MKLTAGFSRKPKFSFAPPKPTGASSLWEVADAEVNTLLPLPDFEISTGFPGAESVEIDKATMLARFPGAFIHGEEGPQCETGDLPEFEPPDWWKKIESFGAEIALSENLKPLFSKLAARAVPGMEVKNLRQLDDGERPASKVAASALYRLVLRFRTSEGAERLCCRLEARDWPVKSGKEGIEKDAKETAIAWHARTEGEYAGIYVHGAALPSHTFSVMKFTGMLAREFDFTPLAVSRDALLDASGKFVG